jgi:hypothetical protein
MLHALRSKQGAALQRHEKPAAAYPTSARRADIVLHRSVGCACGGGCPSCRQKDTRPSGLKISEPRDALELEADQIPDQVMRMPARELLSDFTRAPLHPPLAGAVQAKRAISEPGDEYEQEADRVAKRVMNITLAPLTQHSVQREPARAEPSLPRVEKGGGFGSQRLERLQGGSQDGGRTLPDEVRTFMEPRFGFDFSQVRVHTDLEAMRACHGLNAQAFTHGRHVYYGAGKSPGADALTAHELTHVVQQAGGRISALAAAVGKLQGDPTQFPSIQRVLEVRPPGRGEASAFDRRQELIDQLNDQSAAIQYRLEGREIRYTIIDPTALTHFDRQMRGFIDRPELVPMRLTTGANRVQDVGGNFVPLLYGPHGSNPLSDEMLPRVATEMALHVLAYVLTRVTNIMGPGRLIAAIQA